MFPMQALPRLSSRTVPRSRHRYPLFPPSFARFFSSSSSSSTPSKPPTPPTKQVAPLLSIPSGSAVFRFGDRKSTDALLRFDQDWTIEPDSCWALVGSGARRKSVMEILKGSHRIHPPIPPPGRHPFLTLSHPTLLASDAFYHLTFSLPPSASGEFSDYTSRYHHLLEDDRLTFQQKLLDLIDPNPLLGGSISNLPQARAAAERAGAGHLLERPFIGLSNGETRRARLAMALLREPKVMICEEPFSGLDPKAREDVGKVIDGLRGSMGVVLALREGEKVPEWVTDVVDVGEESAADGEKRAVRFGKRGEEQDWWKEAKEARMKAVDDAEKKRTASGAVVGKVEGGKDLVKMVDVDVSYGEKKVLSSITWTIKTGDRWHLQGHNGSGKTTLLSLLLGDHPRSFSLPPTSLTLFGQPRRSIATPTLASKIGHSSPEIFKSFPRAGGMSVLDAVGTGFQGIFSRRNLDEEQKERVRGLLERFFPAKFASSDDSLTPSPFEKETFASQPPDVQSVLLFLRAVVAEQEVIVLDEPFQFMSAESMARCAAYLEELGGNAAVVWIGHWEGERPWREEDGKVIKLEQGRITFLKE